MADEQLFSNPDDERAYEDFVANQESPENFELATPALICRWRMSKKKVPMLNRHIRALSQRRVNGEPLTTNMLSWAKQHVEWSLEVGVYDDVNGVLMLVIDVNGNAAMTVGAFEPLADTTLAALRARAEEARSEQSETGVAPEVLCRVDGNTLYVGASAEENLCGSLTLIEQLAEVRGYQIERTADLSQANDVPGAYFLVSDEHGVVSASDNAETPENADNRTVAEFLAEGLAKLFK